MATSQEILSKYQEYARKSDGHAVEPPTEEEQAVYAARLSKSLHYLQKQVSQAEAELQEVSSFFTLRKVLLEDRLNLTGSDEPQGRLFPWTNRLKMLGQESSSSKQSLRLTECKRKLLLFCHPLIRLCQPF